MLSNTQENQQKTASAKLIGDPIPADHISISAKNFTKKKASEGKSIMFIPDLGIAGGGLTVTPFTAPSIPADEIKNVPYIEYGANLAPGSHTVYVKCLPTHHINAQRKLRYAVSVNGSKPQVVNLQTKSKTKDGVPMC